MNTYLFTEKYYPKTPNDIIGNKSQINQIKEWLSKYKENRETILKDLKKHKKVKVIIDDKETTDIGHEINYKNNDYHSCIIIIGDHGVGKTCTITAILNQLGYTIQNIDLTKIGSNKNVAENIDKLVKGNNIFDHLIGNKEIKTAIIIDEIESANSPIEKNYIISLLKKNEELWFTPIIFISNGKHSKIVTVLKKNSNIVKFFQPGNDNLMKLLIKICYNEKIYFENEKIAYKIIDYIQKDYRRLVSILQDLKVNYGETQITDNIIEEYCKLCKMKDIDNDIYKSTSEMIINYKSIDECLRLYEGEKVIIPLVMHQNYIKCIISYHKNGNNDFKLANDISKSIAIGDLIENYIYSDQNWDMQEVHGFLTCVNPSFMLFQEKLNINEEYLKKSLNFPMDLNRTSIKKINKRNVINSNNCLKNLEINDFIFANKLIRQLLIDNKVEECSKLFKNYGATIENIESILKIDKINETKTIIPTQIKKKLSNLLISQK